MRTSPIMYVTVKFFNFISPILQAKQPVTRTQSAPLRSSQLSLSQSMQQPGAEQATDTEINARLDSLCLSMTEHALGGGRSDKRLP